MTSFASSSPSNSSRFRRRALKLALAAAVCASIAMALRHYNYSPLAQLEGLRWDRLIASLVVLIVGRLLCGVQWVLILRSFGQRIALRSGIRMWLITESFRWLPGGVWSMFSRALHAKDAGVPPLIASVAAPLELLLAVGTSAIVAVGTLAASGLTATFSAHVPKGWLALAAALMFASVLGAVALARFRPSSRISQKLRNLFFGLRRMQEAHLKWNWLAVTFVFMLSLCFVQGLGFWLLLRSVAEAVPGLLAATCINTIGWLVGFFAFFAPSGLGVREGGTVALLAPLMPVGTAIAATVVWRLLGVAVELICLAGCVLGPVLRALRVLPAAEPVNRASSPSRSPGH